MEATWIFSLCSELISTYHRHVVNRLDRLNREDVNVTDRAELHSIMKILKSIGEARHVLNKGLSSTLMNVSCLNFIMVLSASYTAADYWKENKPLGLFLSEIFDVVDYSLGFVLMCYMADRAHSSGKYVLNIIYIICIINFKSFKPKNLFQSYAV